MHYQEYEAFLYTLVNRWGSRGVPAAQPVASHVPEVARQFRPWRTPSSPVMPRCSTLLFMDRPSMLLDHPEPAAAIALQPDHPPSRLSWRGEEHQIVPPGKTGGGAERIVTAWWGTKASSTRDYFKVQTLAGLWLGSLVSTRRHAGLCMGCGLKEQVCRKTRCPRFARGFTFRPKRRQRRTPPTPNCRLPAISPSLPGEAIRRNWLCGRRNWAMQPWRSPISIQWRESSAPDVAAKDAGIPLIVGCHVQVTAAVGSARRASPGTPPALSILLYPANRPAYGGLCRMSTCGNPPRATKGQCHLTLQDVIGHGADLLAVVVPPMGLTDDFAQTLAHLRSVFDDDRLSVAATCLYDGNDLARLAELDAFSRKLGVPLAATNDVHYHIPDAAVCRMSSPASAWAARSIRRALAFCQCERHMKTPEEMARLFAAHPQAIARTLAIARGRHRFSLSQLQYEYPSEVCPPGKTMMRTFDRPHLAGRGGTLSRWRARLRPPAAAEHEFDLITDLNYPAYFLTVDDIVRFARSRGILCQGRGAAANSAVCYCLGVTAVDPTASTCWWNGSSAGAATSRRTSTLILSTSAARRSSSTSMPSMAASRAALTAEVITYRRRS